MSVLVEALARAETGIPVFPCLENKAPACPHGFQDASADPATVHELWARYSGALIGIPTGEGSGFDVLDIDSAKHPEAAQWLEENRPRLPMAEMQRTRSGGWHIRFRHREGLKNWVGRPVVGIDVRTTGGYVVDWGAEGHEMVNAGVLADWPDWLFKALVTAKPAPAAIEAEAAFNVDLPVDLMGLKIGGPEHARWAIRAAILEAVGEVSTASEGTRNATLNRAAYGLARHVAEGVLDTDVVTGLLREAALTAGLDYHEISRTIASGLRAVMQAPKVSLMRIDALPLQPAEAGGSPFGILTRGDVGAWTLNPPPPPAFVIADFVEQGAIALLAGEGGAGKSYVSLLAAVAVTTGGDFLGKQAERGTAVCLFAEDSEAALYARLTRICKARDVALPSLGGRLFPVSTVEDAMEDRTLWSGGRPTHRLRLLEEELTGISDLRLLVLDNVTLMFDGNEIDRHDVGGFLGHLGAMARRLGIGIILIHHASKSNDGSSLRMASGSTAWVAQCRASAEIRKATKDNGPVFAVRKINNGREWERKLAWSPDGALLPVDEVNAAAGASGHHQEAFLACLRAVNSQGRYASEARTSPAYAPKMFASMKEAGGTPKPNLEEAMQALFAAGRIQLGEVGKLANRQARKALVIVDVPEEAVQ